MNLQSQLIARIVLVTSLCAVAVTAYVIRHERREVLQRADAAAERLAKQLSLQLLRISTGTDLPERFPDSAVFEVSRLIGLCARYVAEGGRTVQSTCVGTEHSVKEVPGWFAMLYRWLAEPEHELTRAVTLNSERHGRVVVTPVAENQLAEAWRTLSEILGLTILTLLAVGLLTYVSLSRLLRPAHRIVAHLQRLQQGDLAHRLPAFEIGEFARISRTVNGLAEHLQQSLAERADLNRKLLGAHEDERRWLTRELHDEIGQCLAGINALAASIRYTAEREFPVLVQEAERIEQTAEHMMLLVQNVLARLRPPELDELGLDECLQRLVQNWNDRMGGRTLFALEIDGTLATIPQQLTGHIYRIVQESLSNAAKHAAASHVLVRLATGATESADAAEPTHVTISVTDNGSVNVPIAQADFGIGLRGMQERVMALGGQFALAVHKPSGLVVRVWLPLQPTLSASVSG
jgi:two-component system, NarL family, sensor histidine kinase UhpB